MTKRKDDTALDFGALRYAIERCEPDLMIDFYADDASLSIINADAPHISPFELRAKAEIAKHLRATFGQEASHRVERDAAVGENLVTFREACEYPDGGRVWVETTLELRGRKIVRQGELVESDARATSQGGSGRGPPT